jgi:predicted AAA+ superfamily ATPase
MATTAREYVYKGLELIPEPLTAFVETRLSNALSGHWQATVKERYSNLRVEGGVINWDNAALFNVMNMFWNEAFRDVLGRTERGIVNELAEVRNRHAHNEAFTYPEAERALDSMRILMESISAGEQATEIDNMRSVILKRRFEEQRRREERRGGSNGAELSLNVPAGLKPWREVIQPHEDVATGNFTQAEFAADLSKVHDGTAASEYLDPKEFYARTFLTQGLGELLKGAAKRLSGKGGDPVIELQTNFGGGKTHSMLALYHMVGGTSVRDLAGLDQLLPGFEFNEPVNRAVLVGTSRGPSDAFEPEEGLKIHTTWGEMAYQLGGRDGYEMVRNQDEDRTSPGSEVLGKLFAAHAPCLILIDEWVAYLRQIYGNDTLPSGTFDSNLSFVQALTEAVKVVPNALLVASLPASQIEVGGTGGQEALVRLQNTFSRVHSSWLPASADESYEIVRRRLFNDVSGENIRHKDNTIKQFMRMYENDRDSFPQGTEDGEYRKRIEISYPIHPELFDQFYNSWSSVDRFQRTRGILRLMAKVVHELWVSNDSSVMIMPGGIPVGAQEVSPELTKYLANGWPAIISSDVDGPQSLPLNIDTGMPTLGQISATRRVARAMFMATAPLDGSQNPGIDQKLVNRAVSQPGDTIVRFSDALNRLAGRATYLHSDNGNYWYATAPSLNRMASDKAAQLDANLVEEEIDNALRAFVSSDTTRNEFDGVHVAPSSSSDIPDELTGCRIVVLGVKHLHSSGSRTSDAMGEVRDIIAHRGSAPRSFRNVLVFLAGDKSGFDNLQDAARRFLAWNQIHQDSSVHNLRPDEANTAQRNAANARQVFETRLKEAWKWLIYPFQEAADKDVDYTASSVSAQDRLFEKIKRNLVRDEIVFEQLGPERLQRELAKYIWQDNQHLKTSDIRDYCGKFVYMPRLLSLSVLQKTVLTAISQMVPGAFAYAEAFDDAAKKYKGLVVENGMNAPVVINSDSVIVRGDVAEANRAHGSSAPGAEGVGAGAVSGGNDGTNSSGEETGVADRPDEPALPKSFRGTVSISTEIPARAFGRVLEHVVEQLTSIEGADVNLTLEISAEVPSGIDNNKRRTLLENAANLGFSEKDIS